MLKIIEENPFRVLGVFVNSTKKDIVASKSKITAFTRIGRTMEFPNDLNIIINNKLQRTSETIDKAESQIALPKDFLKNAMFWFAKATPLDNIALNHLINGSIDMALSIWNKADNVSSLHNRVVAYILNNQLDYSGEYAEKLYFEHLDEFLMMIGCDTLKPSSNDLFSIYVDCISNDPETKYAVLQIADNLQRDELKTMVESIPVEEYFKLIETAISKAENVKNSQGPNARLKAGNALKKETDKYIHELCELHAYSGLRYQVLIDKLANQILQCGIDYYNDSDDIDAPKVALSLMEYACQLAIGPNQKNRCEENTSIVREAANSLPPAEIIAPVKEISKKLNDYNSKLDTFKKEVRQITSTGGYSEPHVSCKRGTQLAVDFLAETRQLVVMLTNGNVGTSAKVTNCCQNLFSDMSSFVMNATIADVNSAWKDGVEDVLLGNNKRISTLLTIIFKNGWVALQQAALLPLAREPKERLQKNIQSLKQIIDSFDGIMRKVDYSRHLFDNPSYTFVDPMFYYSDDKYFRNCKTEYDYKRYLNSFPNGKHCYAAQQKIVQIETERKNKEAEELRKKQELAEQKARQEARDNRIKSLASAATSVDMVAMALQVCNGDSSDRLLDHRAYSLCKNKKDYRRYLELFPSGKHRKEAQEKIDDSSILVIFLIVVTIIVILGLLGYASMHQGANSVNNGNAAVEDTTVADTAYCDTTDVYASSSNDDSYSSGDDSYSSADNNYQDDSTPTVDPEYEKYKNNQLRNGSQPYANWYGNNSTYDDYTYHSEIKVTAPNAMDVIVIVKEDNSYGDVVGHVYIRKGRHATIQISNGTRQVFFYYGNGWNPNKEMPGGVTGGFVSDESVGKDDPIDFDSNILTYTLHAVANGNFQTKRSNVSEAFK